MTNPHLVGRKKMNIIALASYLTNKRGGLELSLLDSLFSLSKCGHSITLLYEEEGDQLDVYRQFCDELIKINSYKFNKAFLADVLKTPVKKIVLSIATNMTIYFFLSLFLH